MDNYSQIKKNTVPSENQLNNSRVCFLGKNDGKNGVRILFVGNSITLHAEKAELGWHNHCGMAASCADKDYVHVLMKKAIEKDKNASFCICQTSKWEKEYKTGDGLLELYSQARDYDADIIIMRIIENCPVGDFDNILFYKNYEGLIHYLNKSGNAKVILTTGFWKHPGDEVIKSVGKTHAYPVVCLGDLGEDDSMTAKGLFEHAGVAMHPGDKGMANIAERIWKELSEIM